MGEIVLHTFDWVPEGPRGFVKDLRARWALEEAGLPYAVKTTPFHDRGADHFGHQPFGQVPWLTDGDVSIFESGAVLLHIAGLSDRLLPADPRDRSQATAWTFAALNSLEMATMPLMILRYAELGENSAEYMRLDEFLQSRLQHTEAVLKDREWLAGSFSIADILTADVLRAHDGAGRLDNYPACRGYIGRATARPAFRKAYADQMAHFAAAD